MTRAFVVVALAAIVGGPERAALPQSFGAAIVSPDARLPDTIRVGIAREGGGYTVRMLPIEEYVAGVVAGEAARGSTPAALEALAITVRTFAVANLSRHRADGFDLCDLTHCQVLRRATAATTRAAEATAGRILIYRGAPASVFYTASCGGRTERPSAVWPGAVDPDFLPSRDDDACEGQPAWESELPAADLARALRSGGFSGRDILDLTIAARSDSGRVARLRIRGFTPDEISGQDLRTIVGRTLGWQLIKSTSFDVRRTSAGFRFTGHGSGHGVGLCVIGSARLAARGQTAAQILARYFPGAEVGAEVGSDPDQTPNVTVSLPAGDEGEREVVRDLALRARDALTRQLAIAAPPRLTLRFHPTVESYQRATGQPAYTGGAIREDEMHFAPLTMLRDRGVLEKTIRHELVHLMTAQALQGRPLWVREGAASYFAGEATSVEGPLVCPADQELTRPVSPGALRNVYARATACFARQVESGRKWNEVR